MLWGFRVIFIIFFFKQKKKNYETKQEKKHAVLTFGSGQQPYLPDGSWQHVDLSGHVPFWSGQRMVLGLWGWNRRVSSHDARAASNVLNTTYRTNICNKRESTL